MKNKLACGFQQTAKKLTEKPGKKLIVQKSKVFRKPQGEA